MEEYLSKKINILEKDLDTNIKNGLNTSQVDKKRLESGKNELPEGKITPWYVIFIKTLIEPIQLILIAAGFISIIAPLISNGWKINFDEFIDCIVIFSIVLIDAILETVQSVKARKSMDSLKSLSKPKTIVLRNNQQQEIDASELVPGDIVILEAGKYVPAELRIIESSDLYLDESVLTGESTPVEKVHTSLDSKTTILAEMKNIAFMSTFVTSGRAVGMVIKTGKNTEIGKIAASINSSEEESTPLEKKLSKFTLLVALMSFVIGILIFITLFFSGTKNAWANYLMVAITMSIGVIPECLAAIITTILSISTKKMAKENVIVKKLQAVETLGSVNVICTDKTGTLTQNKMTVKKIIIDNKIIESRDYSKDKINKHTDLFIKSLVLCNDSITENDERIGDPTELALVDYAETLGYDEQDARDEFERIDEIPFDSERKMMTTVNNINGVNTIFTKGAIDELLKHCSKILVDNVERPITQQDKDSLLEMASKLSDDALRVLSFAYNDKYDLLEDKENLENDLTFLGGVAMIDPVRPSAIEAVRKARDAGIKVVMITGDHAVTALAIARDLDLTENEDEVMSSERLNNLSDEEFYNIIEQIKVFARVNPEHKVRIVEALQKRNNITSMTGDGVNDAPSLAKADIGVAMGITGTDVAKQASDIILTDDNFETIIKGVHEGRNVYQKIKRAIAFVIGVNLANVLSIFILSSINTVSPLEATDILWMNLIVESLIALAIGMGANDDTLMKIKPIKGKNSLFKGIIFTLFKIILFTSTTTVAAYYLGMTFLTNEELCNITESNNYSSWWKALRDPNLDIEKKTMLGNYGRTAVFLTITVAPCLYANFIKLSNWKSSKKLNIIINKPLWLSSFLSFTLNVIVVFTPGMNDNVLNLIPTNSYNSSNWYFVPMFIAFAMIPGTLILMVDGIIFVSYHYFPEPRRRNKMILEKMIATDKRKTKKKRKRLQS
ncbi:cation-translocating P-type ATPase [Spiroplasma apis]|uniref:Cation-transporting ATPase n=1 Tax=Spiroplasma apis B31 TaxID=1276258 RepID=V5RJ60_SPIAP|nr:cation-translocating P-type ATPase [Spiroplasma apis]AHB36493.1 cation-transporting ATPase [Spiroplasma apis B31]